MAYDKLAEQYESFLIAIGGVSITVLALVTSLWLFREDKDNTNGRQASDEYNNVGNLAPLVKSLIIATFCSFVGAQLMAETAGFISNRQHELLEGGATQFLAASIMIYIGVTVCMFAIVLLAGEYKKDEDIRTMSLRVFAAVIGCVLGWMTYSLLIRTVFRTNRVLAVLALSIVILSLFGIYIRKYRKHPRSIAFRMKFLNKSLYIIVILTLASPTLFISSLHQEAVWFRYLVALAFVFAITFTCFLLAISAYLLVGKGVPLSPNGSLPQAVPT